jgi:hypothetical protein
LGTLIRHVARLSPKTIGTLTVAMIQTTLNALLMTPIRRTMLTATRLPPALRAAVALAAITARTYPEHRPAPWVAAKPKPENNFPMNRHPLVQAAFDNGSGSCQGKNILGLLSFGMKATCKEPRCANSGVLLYPPSPQNTLQLPASPR